MRTGGRTDTTKIKSLIAILRARLKSFISFTRHKNKHPHFKSVPQKFIFSHIGPTGIASLKTNALYHVCDTFIAFYSITTALTCHGQLRQAPWTWVKRWRHHDLVSTRVTELHRWHSRSVLLVMRHRTNWCQSPNTLYDSLHRRNICPQAPTPNSVTCITVTAMCTTRILSAEYITRFCAFLTEIFH